jgi:hypothetical protein
VAHRAAVPLAAAVAVRHGGRGASREWRRRRCEQRAVAARAETRDSKVMKNLTFAWRREEKETHSFLDPAYIHRFIHRLTDEYRQARTVSPTPPYIRN